MSPIPEALLRWYARNARPLPWRTTKDPYAIWIAEVLLQQTRVEVAVPYYHRFLATFPTVTSLAAARQEDVLRVWEGLGYYARARHLHRAAQVVVERGGFPTTAGEWRALPGVGPYTAAAMSSIAFGQDDLAVDGNVLRVGARLLGITDPIDEPRTRRRIEEALRRLMPRGRAGDWNQALMDLGATVCRARSPRCGSCPVRRWCAAARNGMQDELPHRRGTTHRPLRRFVAVVVRDAAGRVLLVHRPENGVWGGLWALPEVEEATWRKARPALERLLGTRLRRSAGQPAITFTHSFTHFVAAYTVVAAEAATSPQVGRFVRPEEPGVAVPVPTRKVLRRLSTSRTRTTGTPRTRSRRSGSPRSRGRCPRTPGASPQ